MQKKSVSQSAIFNPRVLLAFTLCSVGVLLAMLSFATTPPNSTTGSARMPFAPSADDWLIVPSENATATQTANRLSDITCLSDSDCWAVGYSTGNNIQQTLIEHWDGTSWTVVSSPNSSPTQTNRLNGVACASPSSCWAVGEYYNGGYYSIIMRWDGTSWAMVPREPEIIAEVQSFLSNVTCVSASNCWAVGYSYDSSTYQTRIEHWDGTTWTVVASPNTGVTQDNHLAAVTCLSASDCWAVGYAFPANASQTLTMRWDGTSWTMVASPNTSATQHNNLFDVTCTSASDCWAVGYYRTPGGINAPYQTLILRWNGTSWATITSPNTATNQPNYLFGVTCESASNCWAVGKFWTGREQTLIMRWDGVTWAIVPSPNTSTRDHNHLFAVRCVSATDCWTVGYSFGGTEETGSPYRTLIQRWDGTSWTIIVSPNDLATPSNRLKDVVCSSPSDCWAVGEYYSGTHYQSLIEHWDGTSWTVVSSPNTSTVRSNYLTSVTCASSSDCWAVGYAGLIYRTLIMHWDGTSWAIVPSPNASTVGNNQLNAVTCVSSSDCWAVGHYWTGSTYRTLVERWDGISWAIVASPNTTIQPQNNHLFGVTCVSGADCWAAGYYYTGTIYQTLVQHWDGASWSIVASPNTTAAEHNFLSGVACASTSDCWTVGYSNPVGSIAHTLIEHWDGSSWAIVSSPDALGTLHSYLSDVICTSVSDCWAVGYSNTIGNQGNIEQNLIERWDGTSWATVTSPNTGSTDHNRLAGLTCAAAWDCLAVGYSGDANAYQTLALKYTGIVPPLPTNVVSRKTHGIAGSFNINLPLTGSPGIECRSGGANRDYQVVLTFPNTVTFSGATATPGSGATGSVSDTSSSPDGKEVTVNLTSVSNAQRIRITLSDVNDGTTSGDVSVPMGMLLGDVTTDKIVSNTDVAEVKTQVSSPVSASSFRSDVNTNGVISNTDVADTKANVSTTLP